MVCLGRPHPIKFSKGCLPQILLGPFLNNLSHIIAKNRDSHEALLIFTIIKKNLKIKIKIKDYDVKNNYELIFLQYVCLIIPFIYYKLKVTSATKLFFAMK